MDTGNGTFERLTTERVDELQKKHGKPIRDIPGVFRVGLTVGIRDFQFEIIKIAKRKMNLKLIDGQSKNRMAHNLKDGHVLTINGSRFLIKRIRRRTLFTILLPRRRS